MAHNSPLKPSQSRDDELDLVLVESESFAVFDRWMDEQVTQLVARWIHMASPRSQQLERIGRRFSS